MEMVFMPHSERVRVERLRERLEARGCKLRLTGAPLGYFIAVGNGSIVTAKGYALTLEQAERWLEDLETRK